MKALYFCLAILLSIDPAFASRGIVKDLVTGRVLIATPNDPEYRGITLVAGAGSRVVFAGLENATQVWNISTRRQTHVYPVPGNGMSIDGDVLAIGFSLGSGITTYDLTQTRPQRPLGVYPGRAFPTLHGDELLYSDLQSVYIRDLISGQETFITSGLGESLSEDIVTITRSGSDSAPSAIGSRTGYFNRATGETTLLPFEANVWKYDSDTDGRFVSFTVDYSESFGSTINYIFKSDVFLWDLASNDPPINLTNNPRLTYSRYSSVNGGHVAFETRTAIGAEPDDLHVVSGDVFAYDIQSRVFEMISDNPPNTFARQPVLFDGKIAYESYSFVPEPESGQLALLAVVIALFGTACLKRGQRIARDRSK